MDFAFADDTLLATIDVAETISGFSRQQMDAFLSEYPNEGNTLTCYVQCQALCKEIKDNSLFTAGMRNEKLLSLWQLYLDEKAPKKVPLTNAMVVTNIKLSIEKSQMYPSYRFPVWLLYPLRQELEDELRKAVASFMMEQKLSNKGPTKGSLSVGSLAGDSENSNNSSRGGSKKGSRTARLSSMPGARGLSVLSSKKSSMSESGDMSHHVAGLHVATTSSGSADSTDESMIFGAMMMRMVALNPNSGKSKKKFVERMCTLDVANKLLSISNKEKQLDLEILRCAVHVPKMGGTEFVLSSAGFRYDFKAPHEQVAARWIGAITHIMEKEERIMKERVRKRNVILASSELPQEVHFRTFSPAVVAPDEDEKEDDVSSSSDEVAEEGDDDNDAPVMPWSQPSPHLEGNAAQKKAVRTPRSGSVVKMVEPEVTAASIASSYGLTMKEIRQKQMSTSYGSVPIPTAPFVSGYGSTMMPPAVADVYGSPIAPPPPMKNVASAASTSDGFGSPKTKRKESGTPVTIQTGYGATFDMSSPMQQYGAPVFNPEVPVINSPVLSQKPYHEAVPFTYHSVRPSDATTPDAGARSDPTAVFGDDDDDDDNDDDDSEVPSPRLHPIPTETIDSVLRKEELELSKKLHRSKPAISPMTLLHVQRGLRDSGYSSVVGGAGELSPRSLAIQTEGVAASEISVSESSSDSDEEHTTSEDSQLERARKKYGDFNERYQRVVDAKRENQEKQISNKILSMADDFMESALRYGRIILEEAFVEESKRTIKPVSPGGYVYKIWNVVFELCSGSDRRFPKSHSFEMSSKYIGHQLKSIAAFLQCNSRMSFPLVAVMDFRGLRLIAYSGLPIDGSTLSYGPYDGTFFDKDENLLTELKQCTKKLNIKPSQCGVGKKRHRVVGGYGLQAHQGHDGRHYVVQVADCFPCIRPVDKHGRKPLQGSEYVELFRPEFVLCYPIPLSANAYKPCAQGMPDEAENREEIDEASRVLEQVIVPAFAKELTDLVLERGVGVNGFIRVSELMHEYGINVRYLGQVMCQMNIGNPAHMLILVEMVARVIKNEHREMMRARSQQLKMVSSEPFVALTASLFNVVFCQTPASESFWSTIVSARLGSKFGCSKETWTDFPDSLKAHVFSDRAARMNLMYLLCQMIGVRFDEQCHRFVSEGKLESVNVFSYESVRALEPVVRQMDFVAEARGWLYSARGAEHESRGFFNSARHFYSASVEAYKASLSRSPTNATILRSLGEVVFKAARLEAAVSQGKRNLAMVQLDPHSPPLQEAKSYYVRAIKSDASDALNFASYANFAENLGRVDAAEDLYLQALTVNPNHVYILVRYGQFLAHTLQLYEVADAFFTRAKEITAKASALSEKYRQSKNPKGKKSSKSNSITSLSGSSET